MFRAVRPLARRRLEFSPGRGHDRFDASLDTPVEVAAAEVGAHDVAYDAAGGNVRQYPLEPHTHLYAHLVLGLGQDEDHAVVFSLLTDLPLIRHADCKLVDV